LWEAVARTLKAVLGKRAVQEKALAAIIGSLGEVAKQTVRGSVYEAFSAGSRWAGRRPTVNNSATFHCRQARADDDGHARGTQTLGRKDLRLGLRLVSNSFRLQVERDVPSFRIAKCKTSNTNLSNFHAVLLYFSRSPSKEWGSQHKAAWSCLWEAVARMFKAVLGKRAARREHVQLGIGRPCGAASSRGCPEGFGRGEGRHQRDACH
jgi:hypothetical protein